MNTVAQPPHSDGKQPAGEAQSSRRTPLAAPFPESVADGGPLLSPLAARGSDESAAPFPHPHANTSLRAATGVDGSEPSALSFDPAFLAAWRETQGQPTDAEPRRS